jgi:hypothetical protein
MKNGLLIALIEKLIEWETLANYRFVVAQP